MLFRVIPRFTLPLRFPGRRGLQAFFGERGKLHAVVARQMDDADKFLVLKVTQIPPACILLAFVEEFAKVLDIYNAETANVSYNGDFCRIEPGSLFRDSGRFGARQSPAASRGLLCRGKGLSGNQGNSVCQALAPDHRADHRPSGTQQPLFRVDAENGKIGKFLATEMLGQVMCPDSVGNLVSSRSISAGCFERNGQPRPMKRNTLSRS